MGFFDNFRTKVEHNSALEELAYTLAIREVERGVRRDALWGKAFVKAEGDKAKAEALYIKSLIPIFMQGAKSQLLAMQRKREMTNQRLEVLNEEIRIIERNQRQQAQFIEQSVRDKYRAQKSLSNWFLFLMIVEAFALITGGVFIYDSLQGGAPLSESATLVFAGVTTIGLPLLLFSLEKAIKRAQSDAILLEEKAEAQLAEIDSVAVKKLQAVSAQIRALEESSY